MSIKYNTINVNSMESTLQLTIGIQQGVSYMDGQAVIGKVWKSISNQQGYDWEGIRDNQGQ